MNRKFYRLPDYSWKVASFLVLIFSLSFSIKLFFNENFLGLISILGTCSLVVVLIWIFFPGKFNLFTIDFDDNSIEIACSRTCKGHVLNLDDVSNAVVSLVGLRTRQVRLQINLMNGDYLEFFYNIEFDRKFLTIHSEKAPQQIVDFAQEINATKIRLNQSENEIRSDHHRNL